MKYDFRQTGIIEVMNLASLGMEIRLRLVGIQKTGKKSLGDDRKLHGMPMRNTFHQGPLPNKLQWGIRYSEVDSITVRQSEMQYPDNVFP